MSRTKYKLILLYFPKLSKNFPEVNRKRKLPPLDLTRMPKILIFGSIMAPKIDLFAFVFFCLTL